jgi:hypothetical protein
MNFRIEFLPPFAPPPTAPLCLPLVAAQQLRLCTKVDNVWIVPNVGGDEIAAITLAWEYGHKDMSTAEWKKGDEDETYIAAVKAIQEDELADVEATIEAAGESASDTDLERRLELIDNVESLSLHRLWEEQWNALGDNSTGLYRSVSAPNVPWTIESLNSEVEANRAFTVHLYRCRIPDGQTKKGLRIRWSNFELEFPSDSPEAKLKQYNPDLSSTELEGYLADLQELDDQAKLTTTEETTISSVRLQVQAAKDALRTQKLYYDQHPTEKVAKEQEVEALKASVQAIKDSKGLTPAQEEEYADLKRLVFATESDASLGIDSGTGTEVLVSLTFIPDPRGYVILHANPGNHVSVHEVKAVTATQRFGTIWPSVPLKVESDGGAFIFRVDTPLVRQWGQLCSGPVILQSPVGDAVFSYSANLPTGTDLDLTSVVGETELEWTADLYSNGVDFPFVYTMTLEAIADPSQNSADILHVLQGADAIDYVPSFQDGRRSATISVIDKEGQLRWLEKCENYRVNVLDGSRRMIHGVIRNLRYELLGTKARRWEFDVADLWAVVDDDLMWMDPPGDGKELGYYLGQLFRNRGFHPDNLVFEDTGIYLPTAPAGEKYAVNPKAGSSRGRWIQEVVSNHGVKVYVRMDSRGRVIFGSCPWQVNDAYRFHVDASRAKSKTQSCGKVRRKVDYAEFYNVFTVFGAVNRATGQRFAARWVNWGSIQNSNDQTYYGTVKEYPPVEDESLLTQDACNRTARALAEKYGYPTVEWEFETFYDDRLSVGDWVTFMDSPVEVTAISGASKRNNRMALSVREVAL